MPGCHLDERSAMITTEGLGRGHQEVVEAVLANPRVDDQGDDAHDRLVVFEPWDEVSCDEADCLALDVGHDYRRVGRSELFETNRDVGLANQKTLIHEQ